MARYLILRLASPLIAFGGEAVDNLGVIRDFPAQSMLTGLLANALGWDRAETLRHQGLQQRLRFGTALEHAGIRMTDYQTAELFEDDAGWMTRGVHEGRAKSPSYQINRAGRKALTLQRFRDYHAGLIARVVLRLEPAAEEPTIEAIAAALDRPFRPLFVGRKPCLPACRIVDGWVEAESVLQALQLLPREQDVRVQWPDGEGTLPGDHVLEVCDERDWPTGLHGGWRLVREGLLHAAGGWQ